MSQRYAADGGPGMLSSQHPRRADVLLYQLERAIAETPLKEQHFAVVLAEKYEALVPQHARKIALAAPSSPIADEYADERNAVTERLRRYRRESNPQPIPADLEEPWVYALPEPYSTRARQTLAQRYGFIGAERTDSPSCSDASLVPSLCKESGEAIAAIGQALANGRIDADNLKDAPEMIREIDELIAAATSARACVIERTGYVPPTIQVVAGREVAK